ncbi:PREDICTED: mammaglobin-A-like [Chinchilla lanigera]|uniref:mammaglobin-A-like n=1 Tax=Chinchilla lanigera TaxID=34839 RepID=UPI00038F0EDB|nr:PREDICTED: mammaglobin-A-like [Chinchilla lanigera]
MKLVLLLALAALPFCCYAGSGCQLLEDAVAKTINPNVTVAEYKEFLQPFLRGQTTAEAAGELKQCFLIQSKETLANVQLLMDTIYTSPYCAFY